MPDLPPTAAAAQAPPWRPLLLLALWLLVTLGLRPLLLPDEGRYANVARDMLLSGDWMVPLLNGLPFFHKPPLMYWLDMAAMALVGVNQFSARFAPFVGAWVMGAAMFMAVRRWHGPQQARLALLVLATCPLFFIGGQYANLDMLVGGLITATVLAFARAVDVGARSLRWLLIAWAFAAGSVLAKGLIGIVLPALVIGPWLLAQRRWRDVLWLLHPAGLTVFAMLALPWLMLMQLRYPGFFDYFIMEQHFRRFAQTSFNNMRPAWFFLAVLPLLTLPWSLWLPAALRSAWQQRSGPDRAWLALYGWWLVAVVGFFSLPSSKLVGYVLPVLAPWCVLLALGAQRFARGRRVTLALSALISLGVVIALAWEAPKSSKPAAAALAARFVVGDRVVFVDEMFYDLPFYAGLKQPPIVASDWADPLLPKQDNWRKALFDAARFDSARARELLWPIGRLAELTCQSQASSQATWFVLKPANAARLAQVPGAVSVYADRNVQLMRAPARPCP